MAVNSRSMSLWTDFPEIDMSPLNIRIDQLHAQPVADIGTVKPFNQFAFHRQAE